MSAGSNQARRRPSGDGDLVIATYNIHGGIGRDRRFDLGRISRVLAEIDADVVALQEVGDVRGRGPAGDHAAELGERLQLKVLFGPTLRKHDRSYGNAILTRLQVDATKTYDLSVGKREPRGCLRADLRFGAALVHVFAVHLGFGRREQRAQASMLLSADILRDAALAWPLVVLGDFNFWFPGPVARMVRRSLIDAAVAIGSPEPTFPARTPLLRLDRIYIDEAWETKETRVIATSTAREASDHLPVVGRLCLRETSNSLQDY